MTTPLTYKRIALVSNSAWSVWNFRKEVVAQLLQAGHEVLVIAPPDDSVTNLESLGCTFVAIDLNNKSIHPLHDLQLYRQLKEKYKMHRPDFIFHYVAKPNIYGTWAAHALKIPSIAVVTGLGYAFASRNWLYQIVKRLYRTALRHAKEVWFLNNDDAAFFIREKITSIEKVKVLPGEGVDVHYFSPQNETGLKHDRPFTFLMSARLLHSKGVAVYANAARILRSKGRVVRCVLIGSFEHQHPDAISNAQLEKWQEEGLIEYGGFAKDVRPFFDEADCFVFPSYYHEGVPRCLLEAASMEKPIITTQLKGCKEVMVHESNGLACLMNNPFDLATQMERMLLLSPNDRKHMGAWGRQWVIQKFDVRHIVREYEKSLLA